MKENSAKENKKSFKMPHALVILFIIILAATIMTWIVPAGEYARVENADGTMVVDPDSFTWLENSPVSLLSIPYYIILSLKSKSNLMYTIMFAGAAFHMIAQSGALQVAVGMVSNKFRNRTYLLIPVMTTLFAVICSSGSGTGLHHRWGHYPAGRRYWLFYRRSEYQHRCSGSDDCRSSGILRTPFPRRVFCDLPGGDQPLSGPLCHPYFQESGT